MSSTDPFAGPAAPDLSCPAELPIAAFREEIIATIQGHPVVIIAGEPGSGKTTQIPKMCLAAGRGRAKKIGCTQPRRIAAISMASRLRDELGPAGEQLVGYRIRFSDHTGKTTRIKFMTDGILLAETQHDRQLDDYDTIIVDEAHERSLNIDFLLGILKDLLNRRPELKVIITSATIDTEKFSRHFGQAPVIQVAGRTHSVEIRHQTPEEQGGEADSDAQSYTDRAATAVLEIINDEPPGDILVFMPTERDIRETAEMIEGALGAPPLAGRTAKTTIMPLYGRLSPKEQRRIFQPVKGRKIVIATNVAETSITVPGIRYVVDTGLARVAAYNPRARTYKLPVVPVARSACDQRAGRCGRVAPGVCIRLYDEEDYLNRPLYTPPEIVRSNLAEVILRMTALNLGDPAAFPFVDSPSARAIRDGYQLLAELGALEKPVNGNAGPGRLSRQGRLMSRLPLDPCISRMILEAREQNALREVCVIAAALSIQDPRIRPTDKEKEADQAHRRFNVPDSDFLFYLKLWDTMHGVREQTGSQGRWRKFCQSHFLSFQRLREWQDIHEQISRILKGEKGFIFNTLPATADAIHKALLSGNLRNIAGKKEKNTYQGGGGREVTIFPGSSLYHRSGGKEGGKSGEKQKIKAATGTPPWIMAAELVETSRLYARTVAAIDPDWIEPLARPLMRYSYHDPHWEKRRGQVVAKEKGTLFGLVVVAGRKVPLARIDQPEARRIFIHSALVEGELKGDYHFLKHNRELLAQLQDLEERSRRRDLVVADEQIFQFYEQHLPPEICDQAGLNRLLKKKRGDAFLQLRREDLLSREPATDLKEQFPTAMEVGEVRLELSYHFAPGAADDGLSVHIPSALAPHLRPERFEWLVPGMLSEKIFFLLKNLPKNLRRQLVPIPQTADTLARTLHPGNISLYQALGRAIYEMFGLRVEGAAWPVKELPEHLRCRFCLLDDQGKILAADRNLSQLVGNRPGKLAPPPQAVAEMRQRWEKNQLSGDQLPDFPQRLAITGPDGQLAGYLFPGLQENNDQVDLRLFTTAEQARQATRRGLRQLFRREFSARLKTLRKDLAFPNQHWRLAQGLGSLEELNRAILQFVLQEIFATGAGELISAAEFQARVDKLRREGFYQEARRLHDLVLQVLQERWEVFSAINRLAQPAAAGKGKEGPAASAKMVAELQQELAALVPPDFLEHHDAESLARLPRYLKALQIRTQRAGSDPAKDAAKADRLAPLRQRLEKYPHTAELPPRQQILLAEYRLMLEEYKISLFAQEVKTLFPVSPQRLEKKWREVEGVV
ncbi:ATP-dependent RNA helicase HrpA [Desulfurivibrio dismutans]|uniref:ATP-dependent RNA helicase HrpA n=1 Tax=Desulfurivibrio dismutans TaxID=1398908 RepID=UPI0023DCC2C7|nr:ATP-dependent RNA helicase HrpA [Desulfurivibrio alkaliphilus]MDF1615002.1 ATP-dependent RNA helicase HrpA [Desulfurivibrio alkaliphilus]